MFRVESLTFEFNQHVSPGCSYEPLGKVLGLFTMLRWVSQFDFAERRAPDSSLTPNRSIKSYF